MQVAVAVAVGVLVAVLVGVIDGGVVFVAELRFQYVGAGRCEIETRQVEVGWRGGVRGAI